MALAAKHTIVGDQPEAVAANEGPADLGHRPPTSDTSADDATMTMQQNALPRLGRRYKHRKLIDPIQERFDENPSTLAL